MSPRISIRLLSAQSDQRLAALAGEGHERAFEALVHRYRRPLLRYCRGMQLTDARAEDVLQQAFLQAWLAFARGTEVREVRPWLYRIVHNAAVSAMRSAADGHSELTEATQARAALAGESELQRKMAVREALTDVAALPQMQQQAIFLTAVDGQSHDEVASVLGISEGALRGLLYRARASLRSAAAALTPPPVLEWAARGADTAAPTAERLAELSAGGGAAGVAGLLLKGTVVAVTAGAVATGATVVNSHSQGGKSPAQRISAAAPAGSASDRQSPEGGVPRVPVSGPRVSPGERPFRAQRRGRRHGGSRGSPSASHQDRALHTGHQGDSRSSGGAGDRQAHDGSELGRETSEGKGGGSQVGSDTSDGHDRTARGGGVIGGKGGSARERSPTDDGGQVTVNSEVSGGKDGSGSGESDVAATPAASEASAGLLSTHDDQSGKRDG